MIKKIGYRPVVSGVSKNKMGARITRVLGAIEGMPKNMIRKNAILGLQLRKGSFEVDTQAEDLAHYRTTTTSYSKIGQPQSSQSQPLCDHLFFLVEAFVREGTRPAMLFSC